MYPALAVLQTLYDLTKQETSLTNNEYHSSNQVDLSSLWVGGIGGMEKELVCRAGIPYQEISAAGLHGVGWKRIPGNLYRLGVGVLGARKILKQFQPNVIFFTGGYLAFPMAIAARTIYWKKGRPRTLLYVPDIEPALALKTLARFSDQIAVTTANTREYYPKRSHVVVTGYPTRLEHQPWINKPNRKEEACQVFGLDSRAPVTLVFGGSKGARSINYAVLENLSDLLKLTQIVHVTGNLDWEDIQKWIKAHKNDELKELLTGYHPYPYLHEEMSAAFAGADLAVCRAGASILGELPLFELPAILVPYPHAWRYQQTNAQYLVQQDAAVMIDDAALPQQLIPMVRDLITHSEKLGKMRQAMKRLAKPNAANDIAQLIFAAASSRGGTL